jgi:hypothetical protein
MQPLNVSSIRPPESSLANCAAGAAHTCHTIDARFRNEFIVKQVLDAGAFGIMFPAIETTEQACVRPDIRLGKARRIRSREECANRLALGPGANLSEQEQCRQKNSDHCEDNRNLEGRADHESYPRRKPDASSSPEVPVSTQFAEYSAGKWADDQSDQPEQRAEDRAERRAYDRAPAGAESFRSYRSCGEIDRVRGGCQNSEYYECAGTHSREVISPGSHHQSGEHHHGPRKRRQHNPQQADDDEQCCKQPEEDGHGDYATPSVVDAAGST